MRYCSDSVGLLLDHTDGVDGAKAGLHRLVDSVGGVRLEDDVIVTETGCRVMTNLPRSADEIEKFFAGGGSSEKFEWEISEDPMRKYVFGV